MSDQERLEMESAKLDREEEQAMADESYVADIDFLDAESFIAELIDE